MKNRMKPLLIINTDFVHFIRLLADLEPAFYLTERSHASFTHDSLIILYIA